MLILLLGCLPPVLPDTGYAVDSAVGGDSGNDSATDSGTNDSGNPINDADGDGFTTDDTDSSRLDCDDSDPSAHPGADEQFDFTDDDCDGSPNADVNAVQGAAGLNGVGTIWMLTTLEGSADSRIAAGLVTENAVALTPMSDVADGQLGNEAGSATVVRSDGVYFGFSITNGEFDGDGQADALAGDPGDATHDGVYVVLDGATVGNGGVFDANNLPILESGEVLGHLGVAATQAGGFVAVTSVSPTDTAVYVLDALDVVSGAASFANAGSLVDAGLNYGAFGLALAGLNIVSDATADLVIGAPNATPSGRRDAGAVIAFAGESLDANGTVYDADDADLFIVGSSADATIGAVLLGVGDADNDGTPDTLIGDAAPGGERSFWIVPGGLSGGTYSVDSVAIATISDIEVFTDETLGVVNQGLGSWPIDDVLGNELVIGAPGESPGRVYVFSGETLAAGGALNADAADFTLTGSDSDDLFGMTLASGDGNGDGARDLAVSAPAASDGTLWFIPSSF